MDKILLKDTGLLPEKKVLLEVSRFDSNSNREDKLNTNFHKELINNTIKELDEIDLSAWLKENGWVKGEK